MPNLLSNNFLLCVDMNALAPYKESKNTLMHSLRTTISQSLFGTDSPFSHFVNGVIVFFILFSIAVIPLHFIELEDQTLQILFLFEKIAITIFTLEYVLRIWTYEKPFRYMFSMDGIIDLIAILPFYVSLFGIESMPHLFLALRIFRILKFAKMCEIEEHEHVKGNIVQYGDFVLMPEETLERIVQKHPMIFFIMIPIPLFLIICGTVIMALFDMALLSIIVAILFFFLGAVFFFKAWLDYRFDVIFITDRRVVVQNRELFGSTSNEVAYESITNVIPNNQGILHWLLRFGDIIIETASAEGTLSFPHAPNPHQVVRLIAQNRRMAFEQQRQKNTTDPTPQAVPSPEESSPSAESNSDQPAS